MRRRSGVAAGRAAGTGHGRTKDASVELENKPADSHVARTDQDEFGKIFRRNMPYGTVTEHGTMFVGFCAEQGPLQTMLESMAGITNGTRDALTRYTSPLTGAYYFIRRRRACAASAPRRPRQYREERKENEVAGEDERHREWIGVVDERP